MRYLLIGILLAFSYPALGKDSLRIEFTPLFEGKKVIPGMWFAYGNQPLVFDVFRFYISNIKFEKSEKILYSEKNSFHLMDFSNAEKMCITLPLTKKIMQADSILLNLGIDSTTNASGAFGGDLDPTNGMYWAWQSGYINLKIEGRSSFIAPTDSTFQYHLGGYAAPFSAMRTLHFAFPKNKKLNITIDLFRLMEQLRLTQQNRVMSPGKQAVQLSAFVSTLFAQQP